MALTRRQFLSAVGVGAAALALPSLARRTSSAAADAAGRPNVLFIMTDQQFADAMSCRMGNTWINTPALDALANGGALFSRAYSPNPLCMPMRASTFTGRYPHETGVIHNSAAGTTPEKFVCMGTYFRRAGYQTAYYGKWHLFFPVKDVDSHGFETPPTTQKGVSTAQQAVEFLSQKHDRPFLLVVSFMNPHNICEYARNQHNLPPEQRGEKLPDGPIGMAPPPDQCPPPPANLAPPKDESDAITMIRKGEHATSTFPVGEFTPDDWRQVRWGYYRLVEKVDAQIGQVLAALRKAGLEDNTLVVFTADHGDCTGAHGFNQKTVFYEESARIPLLISYKGHIKKIECNQLVNTGVDLIPTMLDFAGIPVPEKLTGRSLKPLALGTPPATWRRYTVVENDMVQTGAVGDLRPQTQGRMVRSDRYKYCLFEKGVQREELYDLEKDLLETVNLARDAAARPVLLEHRALLRQFAEENHDATALAMLANDVAPNPFTPADAPAQTRGGKRKAKAPPTP
jgi:choline-sulfatase